MGRHHGTRQRHLAGRAIAPALPNARLIVQRAELESLESLHPLQVPWYQASTFTALRPDALFPIDGDVLIGPGVALLSTPGHTIGNHTLVVNTESGIWASSENVIAAECLTPSTAVFPACAGTRAPGSRRLSLNANTLGTLRGSTTRACWRNRSSTSPVPTRAFCSYAVVGADWHRVQPGNVADLHALGNLPRHADSTGATPR